MSESPETPPAPAAARLERARFFTDQRNWHVEQLMKINLRAIVLALTGAAAAVALARSELRAEGLDCGRLWIAGVTFFLGSLGVAVVLVTYFEFHSGAAHEAARRAALELGVTNADRMVAPFPGPKERSHRSRLSKLLDVCTPWVHWITAASVALLVIAGLTVLTAAV